MKTLPLVIFMLLVTTLVCAEPVKISRPPYRTLVIKNITFDGTKVTDNTPENVQALESTKAKMVSEFTNTIKSYLEEKKLFERITSKETGAKDELIFQSRYLELQLGKPERRMARYFMFGLPIGGAFEIEVKARLLDAATGKEIFNDSNSTNTSWYSGDTSEMLMKYSNELALDYAENIEDFMTEEYLPRIAENQSW